jgi:hypothetical protein
MDIIDNIEYENMLYRKENMEKEELIQKLSIIIMIIFFIFIILAIYLILHFCINMLKKIKIKK